MSLLACAAVTVCAWAQAEFQTLVDFRGGLDGWQPNHFIENLRETPEGIVFRSTGVDPWLESPVLEAFPPGERIEVRIRMRSNADRRGEVFYGPSFSGERAIPFEVINDGEWHTYTVMLPPVEPDTRLRIDPAASQGGIAVQSVEYRVLPPAIPTELAPAVPFELPGSRPVLEGGPLRIEVHPQQLNAYAVFVDGVEMARSHAAARIGYLHDDAPHYLDFAGAEVIAFDAPGGKVTLYAEREDLGGAIWRWTLAFAPDGDGAVRLESRVTVSEPRMAFHLPMVTLLPGFGSFGARKTQALLPGVEYLEDEPSSSEADLRGEQAIRRMVADYRINYPMMTLVHEGRYAGLVWDRADGAQAVFDSPDTLLDSGAHLLGLWLPAVGEARHENALEVQWPLAPDADGAFPAVRAAIIGGHGDSVAPAIQQFVAMRGLPDLPVFEGGFDAAVTLLAHGWLDSKAHEDGTWRHAVWHHHFSAQPAADAVAMMQWLARHTRDASLRARLEAAVARGIERLPESNPAGAAVGHVRRHSPAMVSDLIGGDIYAYIRARESHARTMLEQFDEDGIRRYERHPDRPDYGETHFADHANGYAATPLSEILETAVLSGEPRITAAALELLDKQTALYADSVPRGAQTWEIALHTPDILGSARMVQCFVLGYLLTGREDLLEQARYWAWTGLAFVYLDNPTAGPIGPYATIAVMGATNWVAPNWIGLPVQWCGLVYRSSLEELAQIDTEHADLWRQIAHGITLSGLQQTFPLEDAERQGLLPDFTFLDTQIGDGPAINPGTVQFHVPEVYGKTPFFQRVRLSATGIVVSVPGGIAIETDESDAIAVRITPWSDGPYSVVLSQVPGHWTIANRPVDLDVYISEVIKWGDTTRMILTLTGERTLTLKPLPPP